MSTACKTPGCGKETKFPQDTCGDCITKSRPTGKKLEVTVQFIMPNHFSALNSMTVEIDYVSDMTEVRAEQDALAIIRQMLRPELTVGMSENDIQLADEAWIHDYDYKDSFKVHLKDFRR